MNAAPLSSAVSLPVSHNGSRNGVRGMSQGKFSEKADVLTFRQHFAKTWQGFVTQNFESAAHAAYVFKVDTSTAENWFAGLNAPQGWVMARAVSDPVFGDDALAALRAAQ